MIYYTSKGSPRWQRPRRRFSKQTTKYGSLAQLGEHRAFNPQVVGSNPTRPIMIKAMWHTAEYDLEVEVIRYLGYKQREHWFLIKTPDGQTGVPGSQLSLIPNDRRDTLNQ